MTDKHSIASESPLKARLRGTVTAAFLMMPLVMTLAVVPQAAMAQAASLEVQSLEMKTDGDLGPGSRLNFRVVGTTRAQTAVRIQGVKGRVALRELSPGLYVGRYTIKRTDRVTQDSDVRAVIRVGKRTSASDYTIAEVMGRQPVATVPPPPVPVPAPVALRIERFSVVPLERFEPGAEMSFSLDGIPGATVTVDLPGLPGDVALRETRPGHYEGAYTIRRSDNMTRPPVATLRIGDRVVTANLSGPLLQQPAADNRPPQVISISPREGEVVPSGPPVQITANFEDRGGSGVDPATVRVIVSGRNATPDAQVTGNSVTLRASLSPGRHTVDVVARDRAGNAVRREWSFDVAAVVPLNVPIQILNHGNNGLIDAGTTTVQGRTAAFATVAVKVNASAQVPGGFSVAQQIYAQTVQADGNGNFAFSFSPRFSIPGSRYDIEMTASKANVTNEARLVLHQR